MNPLRGRAVRTKLDIPPPLQYKGQDDVIRAAVALQSVQSALYTNKKRRTKLTKSARTFPFCKVILCQYIKPAWVLPSSVIGKDGTQHSFYFTAWAQMKHHGLMKQRDPWAQNGPQNELFCKGKCVNWHGEKIMWFYFITTTTTGIACCEDLVTIMVVALAWGQCGLCTFKSSLRTLSVQASCLGSAAATLHLAMACCCLDVNHHYRYV